jgi:hypothetical protein
MAKEKIKLLNKWSGGITRDDKSKIVGVASNVEEIDIFTNADFIQAEQIFTADSLPDSTEAYAFTSGSDGTAYAYGKETAASKVRILSVASGGADNPGAWSTLFTSADTTNLAYAVSPVKYFKTTEAAPNYLYYCTKDSATIILKRLKLSDNTESTVGTLSQLSGSYDRISMRIMFGELFITNGKHISKVDKDGVFTETAFTLPLEWTAVDLVPVSDVCVILARYIDRTVNFSSGFWWDLTATVQVDDSFNIPSGGPQWIENHKETVKFCCSINGTARFFQLSGAFPGAIPVELPGMVLNNVATETATQPISPPKGVSTKDKILYFVLYKTDKTGVYAIGQLDADKPTALILSKRFHTSDYSLHAPTALMILGPNFYGAYSDNGTATAVRCESNNSPSRSSSGIYESIWIDDDNPFSDKALQQALVATYPLPASTDVNLSIASDYGSYSEVFRPDGTSLNTTGALLGNFSTKIADKKLFKFKLQLVSSTTNSPKVTSVGLKMKVGSEPAAN